MKKDQSITQTLGKCLDDLERRIDPGTEELLFQEWSSFSKGEYRGKVFSPKRQKSSPPGFLWPEGSINQAISSYDWMALQQYRACSQALESGNGLLLNIRCNYGTGILPSLFGMPIFIMDEITQTLPTSRPLNDLDGIRRLLEAGVPDLRRGFGQAVFEMAERFLEIARVYPKIGRFVHIYHPDIQGPMDVCELIWGSSIFYAFYDCPGLVNSLLDLTTETYTRFLRAWTDLVPFCPGGNVHWGFFHQGSIMLRDDSAMNVSAEMFREFIRPYDERLLNEFGGGAIHFCGKGDHFIQDLARMKGVTAVNLSQPEYNDMEHIYANTVDLGINLLNLSRSTAEWSIASGRDLHGRVHAW